MNHTTAPHISTTPIAQYWRWLLVSGLILILLPVALFEFPVLGDNLNHVARFAILQALPQDEVLQRFYSTNWQPMPNIVYDVWVQALAAFMPVQLAARLFIALTLLATAGGVIVLHRAYHGPIYHGRAQPLWPLLGLLFAWHGMVYVGTINYAFGVAAMLWVCAAWLRWRAQMSALQRATLFSLAALGLYFCHIYAFALWGIWLICTEWARAPFRPRSAQSWRDWLVCAAQAVLPLWLFMRLASLTEDANILHYGDAPWGMKLFGIAVTFGGYDMVLASFALMVVSAALVGYAFFRRWLSGSPSAWWYVGIVCALYWLVPAIAFNNYGSDVRLLIPAVLMAIAATRPANLPTTPAPARLVRLLPWALGALLIIKTCVTLLSLNEFAGEIAAYRAAFAELPAGSTLLTARVRYVNDMQRLRLINTDDTSSPENCRETAPPAADTLSGTRYSSAMIAVGALAAAEQRVFYAGIYAHPGKQPLVATPHYDAMNEPGDMVPTLCNLLANAPERRLLGRCRSAENCYWHDWATRYDALLVINPWRYPPPPDDSRDDPRLAPIAKGRYFTLYRIQPSAR